VTATIAPPPAGSAAPEPTPEWWLGEPSTSPRRRVINAIATTWMIGAVAVALVPLVLILFYVVVKGASIVSWSFLSNNLPIVTQFPGGGIWPAIGGTIFVTAVAALMAVPLGVLAAIYLNEYGRQRPLARVVRFMSDVMTGVPSIVMGLFVAMIWVSSGVHQGYSTFAGALALACLMLPIVIRSTEEMLKLVPDDLRQASDALGARRSRTVARVVIPAALPGIVSGSMLAIARAAGETAPLLFTIFGAQRVLQTNLFHGTNTSLSVVIWQNAQQPFAAAQDRAWGAGLTLIALVFLCTMLARFVSARFSAFET
jgi:phosphate transport system permease protein